MITSGINFKNFKIKKNPYKIENNLKSLFIEKNQIINSLKKGYLNSFTSKLIKFL